MSVLIKPLITEKLTMLTYKRKQYGFVCQRSATKLEIKSEIADQRSNIGDQASYIEAIGKLNFLTNY